MVFLLFFSSFYKFGFFWRMQTCYDILRNVNQFSNGFHKIATRIESAFIIRTMANCFLIYNRGEIEVTSWVFLSKELERKRVGSHIAMVVNYTVLQLLRHCRDNKTRNLAFKSHTATLVLRAGLWLMSSLKALSAGNHWMERAQRSIVSAAAAAWLYCHRSNAYREYMAPDDLLATHFWQRRATGEPDPRSELARIPRRMMDLLVRYGRAASSVPIKHTDVMLHWFTNAP